MKNETLFNFGGSFFSWHFMPSLPTVHVNCFSLSVTFSNQNFVGI